MSKKINNTRILPLRWFANACGEISGWAVMKLVVLDEQNNFGRKYKVLSFIWNMTWPVYFKFGTFYEWDDLSGDGWNDYDENGIPYWEKTGTVDPHYDSWDYIDDNGDAFRVIR